MGTQIENQLAKAQFVAVGEYRGCRAENRKAVSQKTGKIEPYNIVTHVVELGTGGDVRGREVIEYLDKEADVTKYVPPANKGERVIVVPHSIMVVKGHTSIQIQAGGIIPSK